VLAWFFHIGSPLDQHLSRYFLYGGPGLTVVLVAALIFLRSWLRSRIRPNCRYPEPPARLPVSTPPALVLDEGTGEMRFARPAGLPEEREDGWQEFQVGTDRFPQVCCECLQTTGGEHAYVIAVKSPHALGPTKSVKVEVPRCAACAGKTDPRLWVFLVTFVVALIGIMYALMTMEKNFGLSCMVCTVLLVLSSVIVILVSILVKEPAEAVAVDPPRGIVRLRFRNAEYKRMVAEIVKRRSQRHE
jgi:hypothetical protein